MENNNKIIDNPQQLQYTEECIKATSGWEGTTYINICDGTRTYVPNGSMDYYFGFGGITILMLIGLAIFLGIIRMILD